MHYRGTLAADGKEFDASYNRGKPLDFHVGKGQVIKGWDQGCEYCSNPCYCLWELKTSRWNRQGEMTILVLILMLPFAVLDMCPGEKRTLTIQPEWAYGSRGMGPIPAESVLSKFFFVLLLHKQKLTVRSLRDGACQHCRSQEGRALDVLLVELISALE